MAENLPHSIAELKPYDVINLADLTELVAFEDLIVADVEPNYDEQLWASRPHIRNFIRPPKFNGTIGGITLICMDDPYARLMDARDRGLILGSGNFGLSEEIRQQYAHRYHGFILTAEASSTHPGPLAQIQTEMWYYPYAVYPQTAVTKGDRLYYKRVNKAGESVVRNYTAHKNYQKTQSNASNRSAAIARVVARPVVETEKITEANEESRRIGFAVLREAIMHPYGGLHD